ncbi:MAG TPA: hypothetical protein VEQ59_19875 [Polyangiaceae bacterium]|nr:hypothetical protein [Polyangiaceae bacterium]HYP90446.1 hypothetical protein [Polyangiaceae bacterium]
MRHLALGTALTSNQSLLGAALAGLLCLAPTGCSATDDGASGNSEAGAAAAAGSTSAAGAEGSLAGASDSGDGGAAGSAAPSQGGAGDSAGSAGAAGAGPGAGAGGGGTSGAAGAGADPNEPAHITSSKNVGVLTEADFKALCDARGGTVEVMPHCGGFATAKGFSYDNGTQLLSEHTCAGANTCGGWNCVLTD